jgi:tRNA threonylcarbamoyladenosine biosynthesis protein TsaE
MTPGTAPEILWNRVTDEVDLPAVAMELAAVLQMAGEKSPFCLWLIGGVGAGKTTVSSLVLHALGLPEKVPVLSPTYTYIQEYDLPGGRKVAHLDLYRGTALDALDDAGVFAGMSNYFGTLIEWPPLSDADTSVAALGFQPTHILTIEPVDDGLRRRYQLSVAR